MSENRKIKQDTGTEMKNKAAPPQTTQMPQMPKPPQLPEMPQVPGMMQAPQMPEMPQMPGMMQAPQMPYVPQMGQMYNYMNCMPQPPVICCPYLMNAQCPMLQSCDSCGTGYMMGNQYGAVQQPQFMYGSGMYAPYIGDTMNCTQY